MLNLLRKSAARKEFAARLESQLAARARDPVFLPYPECSRHGGWAVRHCGLHGWLVLERLKRAGMDEAAQALTDFLFVGFDEALARAGHRRHGHGPAA